jgi:hypothetical protein
MAAGDRSKRIRQNVQNRLGDVHGTGAGKQTIVYDVLNRVQRRIAETANAIEDTYELNLDGDQELYDVPDGLIAEIKLMSSGAVELKKINLDEVDQFKRGFSASDSVAWTGDDAYYYYRWANQYGFLRSNGSVGATSTVAIYYYRAPDETTEIMSDTIDPVVDRRWDSALFYGALAELTPDPQWMALFQNEVEIQKRIQRSTNIFTGDISVNRSYD